MTALTKKNKRYEWTEDCERSFAELKRKLTSAPILTLPESNGGFDMYSNASRLGLGAVLMQNGKVIAMHQMELLSLPAQMDRFSELYSKACAESPIINQSLHTTHYQNKVLRDKVTELELQLNDLAQASYALRAEIKDLTRRNIHLEVSLAQANHKLKGLQAEKSQIDVVH
ncbi:uncharacterized protein LOC122038803 [Zingiber officinale]|uniref:uncharacterized protein LOC122038803 n=1 Tax=Zingiber officinale TaxID=94328 RepID=UPI001C4DB1E7|nr:uncharacterized protein LOC122038803 [Zingiber officinale]